MATVFQEVHDPIIFINYLDKGRIITGRVLWSVTGLTEHRNQVEMTTFGEENSAISSG